MGFSLIEGFFKSIAMIVVSEIGDKTFFVAALLAMRHSRVTVFSGALGALAVMTVFSAFLAGQLLIWESAELAEVEAQLKAEGKRDDDATSRSQKSQLQKRGGKQQQSFLSKVLSPVFLEAFTLTFLGEWGDRSQIATIGLAAQENVTGVTLGGILGHTLCTGAAVVGGKHLASRISERTVAFCGGFLFLIFGVHSLLSGAE